MLVAVAVAVAVRLAAEGVGVARERSMDWTRLSSPNHSTDTTALVMSRRRPYRCWQLQARPRSPPPPTECSAGCSSWCYRFVGSQTSRYQRLSLDCWYFPPLT